MLLSDLSVRLCIQSKFKWHNNYFKNGKWEFKNVSNVIIIQKVNIKSSVGEHVPPTNEKVGSGAMEE
jgi:hypothetical protein